MELSFEITPLALLIALGIFTLRVLNFSITTLRQISVGRGLRFLAAFFAFWEAFIFAVVIAEIVANLENITYLLAYCLGASVGIYVALWIESRYITSYSTVMVITHEKGTDIVDALRNANYGVTLSKGQGRDGVVDIIRSSVISRDVPYVLKMIDKIHAKAFVDVESIKTVHHGWLPGSAVRRH